MTPAAATPRWATCAPCQCTAQGTCNATITGKNHAAEANILTTTTANQAISLTGNCNIQGDVYATNPDAYAYTFTYPNSYGNA